MNFQDKYTHEEKVAFLKHKSEVFDNYLDYESWIKVQRNAKAIKTFYQDRAGRRHFCETIGNAPLCPMCLYL